VSTDRRWMKAAFAIGTRGAGAVWPNPAVGCLLVKGNRVVGRGWTRPGGRPHAEIEALARAGNAAHGATAYVTLEPCAHHGRSGPCATALIAAGVARVVGATTDPDRRVAGRGYDRLEAAGLAVTRACLPELAEDAHQGFFTRIRHGRPMVTLKLAGSLDGRIATGTGDSRWITGPAARRQVHALRRNHDAVLVGAGTLLADNPDLRVRDFGTTCQPVRVVLDRCLRMPPDGRLAQSARESPVWVLHAKNIDTGRHAALAACGVRLFPVACGVRGLDIQATLATLAEQGLTRVLCEGGGAVAGSLIAAGYVDRLIAFGAGLVIGAEGRPNFGALGLERLAQAPRFMLERLCPAGPDVRADWRPLPPAARA